MYKRILSSLLISFLLFGCSTTKSFKNYADPSKPFTGYMTVNNWSKKDAAKSLDKLVEYNVQAAPFEFFESPDDYKNADPNEKLTKFEKWIKEAKKRKVLLYVTVLNCNLGKNGGKDITADKVDWKLKIVAKKMAEWMKQNPNLFVTPCGEGGVQSKMVSYDKKFQEYCKSIMPRYQMVNNWGARPSTTDGMGHLCQHPSGIKGSFFGWNMSDHSITISNLTGNKGLFGKCDYQITTDYTRKSLKKGSPFLYYHYDPNAEMDEDALKALRDAQK